MSRAQNIVKDVAFYTSSVMLTQLVTVIVALLTRRFLGPVQFGVWAFVQTILMYSEHSHLGTLSAVSREIPFYKGKNDAEKVDVIKNTVFSFSIVTSLVTSVAIAGYALWSKAKMPKELFVGFMVISAIIPLQRYNNLLVSLLRAYKRFFLAGRQAFLSAVLNAFLVAVLSYFYKLYGFMTGIGLSLLFNIVYIHCHEKMNFRFQMRRTELVGLVRYGVPLMLIAFLGTVFETSGRLVITKWMGFEALGHYSIALLVMSYIYSIPNSISIVLVPNLHEKFGVRENKKDLKGYLEKANTVFSALAVFLTGLVWFGGPIMVQLFLPAYETGLPAMRLLVLGMYFMTLAQAYGQFIYAVRKHMSLFYLYGLSCVMMFGFNWFFGVRLGKGIEGVALASSLVMVLHWSFIYAYVSLQVKSLYESITSYFVLVGKFGLMLLFLFVIGKYSTNAFLGLVLFQFLCIPFALAAVHKLGLMPALRQKLHVV